MPLRLVDGVVYHLNGISVYPAKAVAPVPFEKLVLVDRFGCFVGISVDENGSAVLEGRLIADISHDRLEFIQAYDRKHYLFTGTSVLPVKFNLEFDNSGGWKGIWHIIDSLPGVVGYVFMSVTSWTGDTRTLSMEMAEYFEGRGQSWNTIRERVREEFTAQGLKLGQE